jgi:hypothetical protein
VLSLTLNSENQKTFHTDRTDQTDEGGSIPLLWLDLFDFIRKIRVIRAQVLIFVALFVLPPNRIFIKSLVVLPFAVTNLCYAPQRENGRR